MVGREELYQAEAVEFNGLAPILAAGVEREPDIVACRPNDH